MYQSDLPDKFFRIRRHLCLSQENIALEIGITPEAYGKIERGKTRITEERLNQISAIFGIEPWQMIQLSADELILLLIERKNSVPPPASEQVSGGLQLLSEKYDVLKVQPVDMFPHTHHIENVALLELKP